MPPRYTKEQLGSFLDRLHNELGEEEIEKRSVEEFERTEKDYTRFKENFSEGVCYLCHHSLDSVKEESPCVHWLLRKNLRFKKNQHFLLIAEKFGYFQIQAYLRWCASTTRLFANINDLEDEVSNPQNFEATIRFENIEWTFSCSDQDLDGHSNTNSNFPHYHFQMKVNNLPFIKFNDFHVPLSDPDVFNLILFKNNKDRVHHTFGMGEGISKLFEHLTPEEIIETTVISQDELNSTHRLSTFVVAEEGKTISGDLIADLMEESKRTGVSMAKLLRRVPDAKVSTAIYPSDAIPEFSKRNGRGKKD